MLFGPTYETTTLNSNKQTTSKLNSIIFCFNKIYGLNIEGVWCTGEDTLRRKAPNFFMQLFQSNDPCHYHGLNLEGVC